MLRLVLGAATALCCLAMMDYRHFALPNPPRMPVFTDPGIRPPSYLFGLGQVYPPYHLDDPDLPEPFPGCDSRYALVCSVQHAIRLVTRARLEACPLLELGGEQRTATLQNITAGGWFEAVGANGFGVFVLDSEAVIVADALKPSYVGHRFDGYKNAGLIAQSTLRAYIDWVVSWGGGFVPHLSTRISDVELNTLYGDSPLRASAYFEPCANGDRIGVAFGREPFPAVEDCDGTTNGFCAQQNLRRLTGLSLVNVLNSHVPEMLDDYYFKASYTEDYSVGPYFYTFSYQMGWWGYPGDEKYYNPGPFEDNYATCLAGGLGLAAYANGWNLTDWYPGITGDVPTGAYLHWVVGRNGWQGGGFQDYRWYTPALSWHRKISFGVGFAWNETAVGIASGMLHRPMEPGVGPLCAVCRYNETYPCAVQTAYRLAAHATAEYVTYNGNWTTISKNQWFGSMHSDSVDNDGEYAGTWPDNFAVIAFSYSGQCVADGRVAGNVGLDATTIFGSATTHDRFIAAANSGGGWVQYELPDGTRHLARAVKTAKRGDFFYLASGFERSEIQPVADCSSEYSEPCAERTVQALLGEAIAEILASEDSLALASTIGSISNRTGQFEPEVWADFRAYVMTADMECASTVDCPDWPAHWLSELGEAASLQDGGWVLLAATDELEESHAFAVTIKWESPLSSSSQDIVVVSLVKSSPAPPRCDMGSDCPENAECFSGRCFCSVGFRENFTVDDSTCASLEAHTMQCADIRNKVCDGLDCSTCPGGYYCSDGEAIPCSAGYVCPAGESSRLCPKGTIGNTSRATSFDLCQDCPPGTFNDVEGATECHPCTAGTASNETGQSACEFCGIGTYQADEGSRECVACPLPLTTIYRSSSSLAECVCPAGNYAPLNAAIGQCSSCPEGVLCDSENTTEAAIPALGSESRWPFPRAKEGFMSLVGQSLDVYKCKEVSWCPGGAPGSCASHRDSSVIGCAKCEAGMYSIDGGSCRQCEAYAVVAFVGGAILCSVICLAIFAGVITRNQLNQSNAMLIGGDLLTAIQSVGAFQNISVTWQEPLVTIFKVMSVVSFDLKFLRVECLVGQHSVQNLVARQLVAPCAACYITFIVYLKKRYFEPKLDMLTQACNGIGSVFQVFFVAIFLSALTPLICFRHPNGLGYSVSSDRSVLCEYTGEHLSLVTVSLLAVAFVILPYLSSTIYATVQYRKVLANSQQSYKHLQTFRYLFFRYTPEAYWYGLVSLLRGFAICLVPVAFRDTPSLQVLSITSILLGFCAIQMHYKPWRGPAANFVDSGSNILMVLLIVCVAMATDFADSQVFLGIVSAVMLISAFSVILALLVRSLVKHFIPAPFFGHFICHHKAQAAAQARFLQLLLSQQSQTPCFLDSDHLTNLQDLFDVVRCKCRQLCVYLTTDTLRRPWCSGEITIAWQTHQRVATIVHPSFTPPSLEECKAEEIQQYLASADFRLVEYGLTDDHISQAYRWLLVDHSQTYRMPSAEGGRERFEAAAHWVLKKKFVPRNSTRNSKILKTQSVVVSCLENDDEATAAAAVFVGLIQTKILDIAPAGVLFLADIPSDIDEKLVHEAVLGAHAVMVVLSHGSLQSSQQLRVVADALNEDITCIPINTPDFRFPGPEFFDLELPELFGEDEATLVASRMRQFLKSITVAFTTHASQQVLLVQAAAAVERLPRQKAGLPAFGSGSIQAFLTIPSSGGLSGRSSKMGLREEACCEDPTVETASFARLEEDRNAAEHSTSTPAAEDLVVTDVLESQC